MSKATKKELETQLEVVTKEKQTLDALLRYICFKYVSETQYIARDVVAIGRMSSTKRKNTAIGKMVAEMKDNKNLLKTMNTEGLGLPVDMNVFGITAEHLRLSVENGENGIMLRLFRDLSDAAPMAGVDNISEAPASKE